MKYFVTYLLIITTLFISSCRQTPDNISSSQPSFSESVQWDEEARIAISAIKDVIQNKKEYFCAVYGKNIYLKDFHSSSYLCDYETNEYTDDEENNTDHTYSLFCVIDMDRDGIPEVLLESETTFGNILIFHYKDGIVYGSVFAFRGFKFLKEDSTFSGSGGAPFTFVGKIKFSKEKIIYSELCNFDGLDDIYQIDGVDVRIEEIRVFR